MTMIDMHAHWRPAEAADALRARTREPRIVRNNSGVEVLTSRMGDQVLAEAFDEVDFHLARMDRQNVSVSVGGVVVPVLFSGAQGVYAGEDQVNVGPLPASLGGRGNVSIVLTAEGQTANTVNVTIK